MKYATLRMSMRLGNVRYSACASVYSASSGLRIDSGGRPEPRSVLSRGAPRVRIASVRRMRWWLRLVEYVARLTWPSLPGR